MCFGLLCNVNHLDRRDALLAGAARESVFFAKAWEWGWGAGVFPECPWLSTHPRVAEMERNKNTIGCQSSVWGSD